MQIRPLAPGEDAECERILRSLPDWFGIEGSLVQYVLDVGKMDTHVAEVEGRMAGFLTLRRHFPQAAEIHVMAIRAEQHRRGVGRALVSFARSHLREVGVEYLQVKTLGPSRPDTAYAATRAFYEAVGFRPLEEFPDLWNPSNPCLILIQRL